MHDSGVEIKSSGEKMAKEREGAVTFLEFVYQTMGKSEACLALPEAERKMPSTVNSQIDLHPENYFSANVNADQMGAGCMEKCGCHLIVQFVDHTEGLANVCN